MFCLFSINCVQAIDHLANALHAEWVCFHTTLETPFLMEERIKQQSRGAKASAEKRESLTTLMYV